MLGFEGLAVDFVKFSDAGEAFFYQCFTLTDVFQCTEYLLIIPLNLSSSSDSTSVDGRIVNTNTVVSLRHRRNSVNSG